MSEISLNVAPAPELLKAAPAANPTTAPGRASPTPGEAARASNPFAALLSGVLAGAQPVPEGTGPAAATPSYADFTAVEPAPAGSAPPTGMLSLPGTATPLADSTPEPAGDASGRPAGNPLPGTGKELPLDLTGTRTATNSAATAGDGEAATSEAATTPATNRPRVFLADLALSRPLEPASVLPAGTAGDGARATVAVPVALRETKTAAAADGRAPLGAATPAIDSAVLVGDTITSEGAPVGDVLALRAAPADLPVRVTGLPGTGSEFLAGQLAAFAANNSSSADTGVSAPTGTALTDAGSAALLGRLGSTGLPALQPLGEAGAFAGGLADRLLTLGGPGAHSARLKLHPEQLGELDVEITMKDGTAQVWFGTTTGQAREAIEASLPRLRELFAEQGIELTRTQIDSGGSPSGQSGFGQERRMTGGAQAWNDAPDWQPRTAGAGDGAASAAGTGTGLSARLLDVWA